MEDRPNLLRDQKGAMMVLGLFMALFMVGSLYYILGVGDAIIYRRVMQDGVDAGSYGAAVTAARGMNFIVMINIIMAIIVGILIILRLIENILWLLTLAFDALCAAIVTAYIGCPAVAVTEPIYNVVSEIADAYEEFVEISTNLLHNVQLGLKRGWPIVAEGRAIYEMTGRSEFDPPVKFGFVLPPLGPSLEDGSRGLPVVEDDNDELCERALGAVGGAVSGGAFDNVSDVGGGRAGTYISGGASGILNTLAGDVCSNDDIKPPMMVVENRDGGGEVWLGHEEFQYRGFAFGESVHDGYWARGEKGTRGAQGFKSEGRNLAYTAATLGRLGTAQAEFYFNDDTEKENWMWGVNWRARMRRFRAPQNSSSTSDVDTACSTGIGIGDVCEVASDFLDNALWVH